MAGEMIATQQLRSYGVRDIQTIETGWKVLNWLPQYGQMIAKVVPYKKVAGDLRGVLPGGISVLVEVKVRSERLSLSDLKYHQRESLSSHHRAGGVSLVVWVEDTTNTAYVLRWPIPGLVKYHPLKPRDALALDAGNWLQQFKGDK